MESNDRFKDRPYGEGWRWGIPEQPKRSGWWTVAAIAVLAFALALLLAGCNKPAPKPNPLGDATQTTSPIAMINGQSVPCVSDTSGGVQCGLVEMPANAMPVLTVDEKKGSIKCEAGEQYVEQFDYEIKPKVKRVLTFEEPGTYQLWQSASECAKDLRCREQKEWAAIYAAPKEIAALKRRVAAQEKRIAELEHPAPDYTAKAFESPKIDGTIYSNEPTGSSRTTVFDMHADGKGMTSRQVVGDRWTPVLGYDVYVPSKEYPFARFHYEGGAWCNVWADAEGIHWEACK